MLACTMHHAARGSSRAWAAGHGWLELALALVVEVYMLCMQVVTLSQPGQAVNAVLQRSLWGRCGEQPAPIIMT